MIHQIQNAVEKRELIKVTLLQNTLEEPQEAAETIARQARHEGTIIQ